MDRLQIIKNVCLKRYIDTQPISIQKHLNKIADKNLIANNFRFYLISSSCNSSMIEGTLLDTDTYYKLKDAGYISKDFSEIENIIDAYQFSTTHAINLKNILAAHAQISATLPVGNEYKGAFRDRTVFVKKDGQTIYTGADSKIVAVEMDKLIHDINLLLTRKLSINATFYYASMIHLVFVCIHPFADGNGRVARLLEKWFLAQKLGKNAWYIQSEKLYYKRRQSYYKNLHIGDCYNTIDYHKALPFLLMLPMALRIK